MASAPALDPDAPPVAAGSRAALTVLVALVVVSPWAAGSVHPLTTQAITLLSLATALVAVVLDARRGTPQAAPFALWPLVFLWLIGVAQLVPLPVPVHRLIAPGSATVWHPDLEAAASVLGPGPRPLSLYPEATRRSLAFTTGLVALALAAVPALRNQRRLLRASVAILAGGVAVVFYALVARLVFGNKLYGVWSVPTVAPFGPFVNKNHFAGYVELVALLAVGLASGLASEARRGAGWLSWIESRRARWIVVAWGAVAILILAVPVSLSRGGVVSLAAGLAAFFGMRLWSRHGGPLPTRRLLAAGLGGALLLAAAAAVLPAESRERVMTLAGVASEQSGSFRLTVWRDSLRLVSTSPWLGSGFGTFQDALPRFKTAAGHLAVEHAESDYLELMAEAGLAGALLVVSFAALLTRGLRGALGASSRLARGLTSGAVAGLVSLAVHSTFDFNLRIPSNALLAVALVAMVLARAAAGVVRLPRLLAPGVVAVTLGAALLVPWAAHGVDPGLLMRATGRAPSSLRWSSLDADLRSYLQRRPADAAAWLALAWVRFPTSREDASSLGAWAVRLDPTSQAVRDAQAQLVLRSLP